jgi:hypothetical protein
VYLLLIPVFDRLTYYPCHTYVISADCIFQLEPVHHQVRIITLCVCYTLLFEVIALYVIKIPLLLTFENL